MKLHRLLSAFLLLCLAVALPARAADAPRVYELRTYTATPGNLPKLLERFRAHTMRIFEKHGMTNVGYWVPMDAKDGAGEKLVYLLSFPSRDAAKASWKAFNADPEWQDVRRKSEAAGKIVAKVESVFVEPTDYARPMETGKGGAPRVFELRTYHAAEGKLDALDARFREHTIAIFSRHAMTSLGYFHPLDADKGAGRTLIYFLAHSSREAATAAWSAFRSDEEWTKVRTASEKDGKLTTKVDSVFLTPTDFSPLQ